jgi:perosamine synthetase
MFSRLTASLGGILAPGVGGTTLEADYQARVAEFFGGGRAFAFWKGRIALYALLKALRIGPGDQVILPGYTCVMVPGPVIYAGAKPVYADIDPQSFSLRVSEVERLLNPSVKAILVQHTYGIPGPIREIVALARSRGVAVIEDCCHTFGSKLGDRYLGAFGDAAFFSGQWNKPFSTGLGGLALVNNPSLASRVEDLQREFEAPSRKAAFVLAAQLMVYEMIVYPSTAAWITRLFRWMTKKGLVVGSSSKAEFEPTMPAGYARRASAIQCRMGRIELSVIQENMDHRRRVAARYSAQLPRLGFQTPTVSPEWDQCWLRFPLRVSNKAEALAKAASYGVEIGSWFECPLHPKETNQEAFGYSDGMCPEAETAAREVINLPTHRRVGESTIVKTLAFVGEVCRPAENVP